MQNFSISNQLIKNTKNFLKVKHYTFLDKLFERCGVFYGWGRKNSGLKAMELAKKCESSFVLLEDGFIRSLDLGVNGSPSFSLMEDDMGIYYDAIVPSRLENILSSYDFTDDAQLMDDSRRAMGLIREYNISKYNNASLDISYIPGLVSDGDKVLIIAQTAGDSSLEYGMFDDYTTDDMIRAAISENPDAQVYLKIHPDVLSGKKSSDIAIEKIPENVTVITKNVNPIVLLKHFDKVYTKTSGMGFEALIVGCECVCYGMPFYAGWGITHDKTRCDRRQRVLSVTEVFAAAYILYTRYHNPYTNKPSDIFDTIKTIVRYRQVELDNQGRLFFFGFSKWKRNFMRPFFKSSNHKIFFCKSLQDAIDHGLDEKSKVFIWGMKEHSALLVFCEEKGISVHRVEDGFIRSVSLGSDLTKPYSLVVDSRGIYIDPGSESDLEHLYNTYEFDEAIKQRAKVLIFKIIASKFSKYNGLSHQTLHLNHREDQKVILIPGQVEDDASIIYGGMGMSTLKLLEEVRANNPEAYILYKPHPDVLSGNRLGLKDKKIILRYVDEVVEDVSIDSCLEVCDEVHTITSTVGYEALLREKKVYTYGLPFYAGWGLTIDKFSCERRVKKLDLYSLVAGAMILYPRYVSPKTNTLCEVEVALDQMLEMQNRYFTTRGYRMMIDTKTFILRRLRRMIEFVLMHSRRN